eukprot:CAMPEP_0202870134 /NCGR_PEP_ID=MMETSP1391-20130828/14701_1 /ASSEMBLY_ACC=CAM_ASM_000867 /TAXON_ID=1034604 /ORGANISM="Chlamydomonas leiostraca, Strain SAG 11-49" /LENGTH=49 /DNA_ID= /DNA_START= /DNA_END= /DNA_ORIENTATION=
MVTAIPIKCDHITTIHFQVLRAPAGAPRHLMRRRCLAVEQDAKKNCCHQ